MEGLLSTGPTRLVCSILRYLADPDKARGCSTKSVVINWLIKWKSHKIDTGLGHSISRRILKNALLVQKLRQFYQNGWILPSGGISLGRVCDQQGYPINFFRFWGLKWNLEAMVGTILSATPVGQPTNFRCVSHFLQRRITSHGHWTFFSHFDIQVTREN